MLAVLCSIKVNYTFYSVEKAMVIGENMVFINIVFFIFRCCVSINMKTSFLRLLCKYKLDHRESITSNRLNNRRSPSHIT